MDEQSRPEDRALRNTLMKFFCRGNVVSNSYCLLLDKYVRNHDRHAPEISHRQSIMSKGM